jgi:hypothetical protein
MNSCRPEGYLRFDDRSRSRQFLRLCQVAPDPDERLCGVRRVARFNDVPNRYILLEDAVG